MSIKDQIAAAEEFVKSQLAGEATGHDWWHIERVRNNARQLVDREGGEESIIDLALLLHDVGDRKVIKQEDDDYTIAKNFMTEIGIASDVLETVMHIIQNMSFTKSLDQGADKPDSIEFQIVQDADRLDALGAVGIARAFAFGGSRSRPLYDPEYKPQNFKTSDDYKNAQSSSLHHFDEKLFLLKDLLNTESAKQIAAERDAYMRQFKEQFLNEWYGRA